MKSRIDTDKNTDLSLPSGDGVNVLRYSLKEREEILRNLKTPVYKKQFMMFAIIEHRSLTKT